MKSSRFKYEYNNNASKLHKQVGDILRESIFKNYKIYQEYPVNKVNPNFLSGREKFDWYIKDLNLIIEVHGEQHYTPVCFGGITIEEAEHNFRKQIFRDTIKKEAALNANARYIVIKYDETINKETLAKKIISIDSNLEDSIDYELSAKELEKHEEELQTRKEKRQARIEAKKLASERRKEIRQIFKASEKHKNQLTKAKKYRKEAYQKAKRAKEGYKYARSR